MSTESAFHSLVKQWQGRKLIVYTSHAPALFERNIDTYANEMGITLKNGDTSVAVFVRYLKWRSQQAMAWRKAVVLHQLRQTSCSGHNDCDADVNALYDSDHAISVLIVPCRVTSRAISGDGGAFYPERGAPDQLVRMLSQQHSSSHFDSTRNGSLSFVIVDAYTTSPRYMALLRYWFDKVSRHGIIVGPSIPGMHVSSFPSPDGSEGRTQDDIEYVVDSLVSLSNSHSLATKLTRDSMNVLHHTARGYSTAPTRWAELERFLHKSMGAWYVIKH